MKRDLIIQAWLTRLLGRPFSSIPFEIPVDAAFLSMQPDGAVIAHKEQPWLECWHATSPAEHCVPWCWEGHEVGDADGEIYRSATLPATKDEHDLLLHFARAHLTIDELQALARTASNSSWVRWWALWNHPATPTEMAISLMDENGNSVEVPELLARGFYQAEPKSGRHIIYVCQRVDSAGQPWVSKL